MREQLRRKDMLQYFANLRLCLIGMEACGRRASLDESMAIGRTFIWQKATRMNPTKHGHWRPNPILSLEIVGGLGSTDQALREGARLHQQPLR